MNQQQCQTCHGNTDKHLTDPQVKPSIAFTKNSSTPSAIQDTTCIKCHSANEGTHWPLDKHQDKKIKCVDCHKIHTRKDPVLLPKTQSEICTQCHQNNLLDKSTHHLVKQLSCTSCHAVHSLDKNIKSDACLTCHTNDKNLHWNLDKHQFSNLNCHDCHQVHVKSDPILNSKNQIQICTKCHQNVGHDILKISSHHYSKEDMTCTSCHAAHGTLTENKLKQASLNQTCYECHAEHRGPFLWEHAPVREQCTQCHASHGSNVQGMLNARVPFLCQQCHSIAGHPSTELGLDGITLGNTNNRFLLVKGCLNCHSAIHGSNHPSGVKLTR